MSSARNVPTIAILTSSSAWPLSFARPFGVTISTTSPIPPQTRSFWTGNGKNPITATFQNLSIKRLEREANLKLHDADAQYEFLNALTEHGHLDALVHRVKHQKQAAMDGNCAILFLQALQRTNQLSSLQADDLLRRIQQTTGVVPPTELFESAKKDSKSNQVRLLLTWLMTGSVLGPAVGALSPGVATGAALGGGAFGGVMKPKGESAKNPLHVAVWNPPGSLRQLIGFFLVRVALILVGISAVSALMDERGLGRGGLGGLNVGSKHVQEADGDKSAVRFEDVKGVTEAKAELEEIVLYLRDPSRFTRLGGKLPRGLLLTGPPGTGKTLLAKAIAGEAGVPFFYASGSQFEEVYVGLGAKRVRELFEAAKKKSPAIIFIDEIDAVGGNRRLKDQSSLKMTLNELLVQMDGFDENNGIIVIGATNFAESLDDALLRPGRFDKQVTVPLPDVGGRKEILEMYAKKTKIAPDVDLEVLARGTTGFSGADLFNLMNQAALKAAVDGLPHVTMTVLEYAKDKILMGAERTSAIISPETAKSTAYHEAGHALVAVMTPGAMPVHKATIMPRGRSLGMVGFLPEGDQTSESLKQMLAMMDVSMGGRVAEELIFGADQVTSGASADIQMATQVQ
jgi:ATP-dependent metalloprotease